MARGGRYTVKTVSAKNAQVGPTSEKRQTTRRTIVGWARGGRDTVKTMAEQPIRRYRLKTAKSGRRRKTSNDTENYSRVGARRSRYGENHGRTANTTVSAKNGQVGPTSENVQRHGEL